MRRACIDIGSNTTRLLVADVDGCGLVAIHQQRAFTALGRALDEHGRLPAAKLAQVVTVVTGQLADARRCGAEDVVCVATAGVRRARNGGQLVALIDAACDGLTVAVLGAREEALHAFVGAAWWWRQSGGAGLLAARGRASEPAAPGSSAAGLAVVDVGGGSSELAVGEPPDRLAWWRSVELGSADLVGLPVAAARARARVAFAALPVPPVDTVVAVGGTVASLMRMVGAPRLDAPAFARTLTLLERLAPAALAARFQLDPERLPLLPGGLLILEQISARFGQPLLVGGAGLREGLLLRGTGGRDDRSRPVT